MGISGKVIFNSSKIGWVHINVPKFVELLSYNGLDCLQLYEEEYEVDFPLIEVLDINEEFVGINLYEVSLYNICNELKIFKNELNFEKHYEIIKKWYSLAKSIILKLTPIFKNNEFSLSIIFHGHLLLDACLLALSKLNNVPFLSLEATANKDRVVWDNVTGKVITYNLSSYFFSEFQNLRDTNQILEYCNFFKNNVLANKRNEHISVLEEKSIPIKEPFILFLAQVYNDASQLFALEDDFSNPVDVIESLVNIGRIYKFPIIVKLHPKEFVGKDPVMKEPYDFITYKRIKKLESKNVLIDFDNSYNTYDLIYKSKFVVTVNSQAGLEACLYDKPVLSYRNGFYSNLGFTYDYKLKNDLSNIIQKIIKSKKPKNRNLSLAKLFFYVFFEKYCLVRTESSLVNKVLDIGNFKQKIKIFDFFYKLKNKLNV